MYLLWGQQNLRLITLILLSAVAFAHLGTDVKTVNTGDGNNGAEIRDKRSIGIIGAKLGRLGSKAGRYLPVYFRVRRAKTTLLSDAKLIRTQTIPGHKLTTYKKEGGCTRALKDFGLMATVGTKIIDGIYFHGTVGDKSVSLTGNYQKSHGCEIRMGSKSGSGEAIYVFYPENAKFVGFDK